MSEGVIKLTPWFAYNVYPWYEGIYRVRHYKVPLSMYETEMYSWYTFEHGWGHMRQSLKHAQTLGIHDCYDGAWQDKEWKGIWKDV